MLSNEEMHHYMDTYSPYLLQLSFMYVKNEATAEDIVQDVFIQFFKTFEQYEQRAHVKTYLTKITINFARALTIFDWSRTDECRAHKK